MRKMLVVLAALLLVTASAQAAWVVSLVNTATGLSEINPGAGVYTISVVISDPAPGMMMIGGGGDVVAAPGTVASGLVLNTVDFDADLSTTNTTDPNQHFEIMTFGKGPYTAPISIATFTLTATNAKYGDQVNLINAIVGDDAFGTNEATVVPLVITPEPATALLLIGALPFLRRRHA